MNTAVFTQENESSQAAENKSVNRRKLPAAPQFPVGDDVSALNPLRSSAWFLPSGLHGIHMGEYKGTEQLRL
jgi:hypothetical protein